MTPAAPTRLSAPGVWTLDQALQNQQAGTWPYGGPLYVEDVFGSYTYAGNSSTQTITNGIDLASYGGLVWIKKRNGADNHALFDTTRGNDYRLTSNTSAAQQSGWSPYFSFTSSGMTLGSDGATNGSGYNYTSWTFRKQKKFFDIQTYTGTGSVLTVNHDLGSTPGCILIKNYNPGNTDWIMYHRGIGTGGYMILNGATGYSGTTAVSAVSDTTFTLATGSANWNSAGQSYIAYIFAHDAGGFGATGNDNVISCGSFVTNSGGNATINLGYEPQWVMIKPWAGYYTGMGWEIYDQMRGLTAVGNSTNKRLEANTSGAESTTSDPRITATGFTTNGYITSGDTSYIYIAIRRPMKTPTTGTQVYKGVTRNGTGVVPWVASGAGFPPDLSLMSARDTGNSANTASYQHSMIDRLRRITEHIQTVNSYGEGGGWGAGHIQNMDGYDGLYSSDASYWARSGSIYVDNHFRRAPGFMDIVAYTGTGSARTVDHGLKAVPELMIVKRRDTTGAWSVYHQSLGNTKVTFFDTAATINGFGYWNNTSPTSSVLTVNTNQDVNSSGSTYVAYLFASLPGISKVGSYTGTGSPLTVDCGFTTGARFVLIKRTNATGSWWFFDTARGMAAGNSKALWLDTGGAAEVSGGYVYTTSVGFVVESSILDLNTSGGSYIYLAIS